MQHAEISFTALALAEVQLGPATKVNACISLHGLHCAQMAPEGFYDSFVQPNQDCLPALPMIAQSSAEGSQVIPGDFWHAAQHFKQLPPFTSMQAIPGNHLQ